MNLEEELLKIMSKEELRGELGRVVAEFHGFITKPAALKVIAAERGILKKEITTIGGITTGARNINLVCRVVSVGQLKKYPTKTRSRLLTVEDNTGRIGLLLWNEDAEEAGGIKVGDEIEINNAYEKNGKLSLGYAGYIRIVKRALFTPLAEVEINEGKRVHLRSFVKDTGRLKTDFTFSLSDGEKTVECVLTNKRQAIEKLKEGKEIVIENGLVKDGRVLVDEESRLFLKRENVAVGVVEKIEPIGNEGMLLVLNGNEVRLSRSGAFKLLGVKEVPDVQLSTLINLKRNMFLGRNIVVELESGANGDNVKSG